MTALQAAAYRAASPLDRILLDLAELRFTIRRSLGQRQHHILAEIRTLARKPL